MKEIYTHGVELEYTDEATFKTEKIIFSEEHVDLTEDMMGLLIDKNYRVTPKIVSSDKKSLQFAVNLGQTREERDRGSRLYRVKIEKI